MRLNKILAGSAGGYLVMVSFHVFLGYLLPRPEVIATAFFSGYILWAFLLLWAFTTRHIWRLWMIYLVLTFLFLLPRILKITPLYGS